MGITRPSARATLERLATLRHIDVHVTLGEPGDVNRAVSGELLALGFERQVAVVVPSFTTAAMIAARTDYVAWLPAHAARLFCEILGLRALHTTLPPFEVGCSLVWHERTHADPGAARFREVVASALRPSKQRATPGGTRREVCKERGQIAIDSRAMNRVAQRAIERIARGTERRARGPRFRARAWRGGRTRGTRSVS